jgi:hypothetical protein
MIKLICKHTETLKDIDGVPVFIIKGEIYCVYLRYSKDRYMLYAEDDETYLGEIWGTVSDYFMTLAESRDQRIDDILND